MSETLDLVVDTEDGREVIEERLSFSDAFEALEEDLLKTSGPEYREAVLSAWNSESSRSGVSVSACIPGCTKHAEGNHPLDTFRLIPSL